MPGVAEEPIIKPVPTFEVAYYFYCVNLLLVVRFDKKRTHDSKEKLPWSECS